VVRNKLVSVVGVKSPNYDVYGLFRALHSHNPGIKMLKNSRWIYGTQCQSLNMTLKAICLPVISYYV
jgi:hypothetical protein